MGHRRRNGWSLFAAVLAAVLAATLPAPGARAQDTPEELILRVRQAKDLARAALQDAVAPIGGLLSRISPSTSFAADRHGFGYVALSLGATGLGFDITNPDYTLVDPRGVPETVNAGVGAVYGDLEVGLYEGLPNTGRLRNVGSFDVLLRLGYTLGDQDNLTESVDLGSLAPIFGAGFRLGILSGPGLPALSLSAGFNHFTDRVFRVQGSETFGSGRQDFAVALDFQETSSFLLGEVSTRVGALVPSLSAGVVWSRLEARYDAEVVFEGGTAPVLVTEDLDLRETSGMLLGGLEVGGGIFRAVFEGGLLGDEPFGAFSFKFARGKR